MTTTTATRPAPTTSPATKPGRWGRRLRKAGIRVLVVTTVAAALGASTQAYAEHRDADRYPAPGELIDVDGHQLHLNVTGTEHEGHGPTVILESGMGPAYSDAWAWYQDTLDDRAQVVSYDRPGLGWSEPHAHGTDSVALAKDLRAALETADVDGPYLVVGHSLGALHARVFAQTHAAEVAGLVLLDPSHEDQFTRLPQSMLDSLPTYRRMLATLPVAARFGATRLFNPVASIAEDLPADVQDRADAQFNKVNHLAATSKEMAAFDLIGEAAHKHGSDLGSLPLLVLAAGPDPSMPEATQPRRQMTRELARLSTEGAWDEITDADHISLVAAEKHAEQVIPRITALWRRLR